MLMRVNTYKPKLPIKGKCKNASTSYLGVSYRKNYFQAQIGVCGKTIHLGNYKTVIEAAQARDEFIIENKLERRLNFKKED